MARGVPKVECQLPILCVRVVAAAIAAHVCMSVMMHRNLVRNRAAGFFLLSASGNWIYEGERVGFKNNDMRAIIGIYAASRTRELYLVLVLSLSRLSYVMYDVTRECVCTSGTHRCSRGKSQSTKDTQCGPDLRDDAAPAAAAGSAPRSVCSM